MPVERITLCSSRSVKTPARQYTQPMCEVPMGQTGSRFALFVIFVLAVLSLPTAGVAGPSGFQVIDIPNARPTVGTGINNKGQVLGLFRDASGTHGFLFSEGQFTTINAAPPNESDTEAYGLNDKGDIVGKFLDGSGEHGFLLSGGAFTHINISTHP